MTGAPYHGLALTKLPVAGATRAGQQRRPSRHRMWYRWEAYGDVAIPHMAPIVLRSVKGMAQAYDVEKTTTRQQRFSFSLAMSPMVKPKATWSVEETTPTRANGGAGITTSRDAYCCSFILANIAITPPNVGVIRGVIGSDTVKYHSSYILYHIFSQIRSRTWIVPDTNTNADNVDPKYILNSSTVTNI